ncbi:MAG: hypothetical protein RLZ25_2239 [Pseudomonadota bacterium]|jgi:hypothetical protein
MRRHVSHRPDYALWIRFFLAALPYGMVALAQAETVQVDTQKKPEAASMEMPHSREDPPKPALSPDETRVEVELPQSGIKVLKGKIRGHQASVFALAVRQGQQLKVTFESHSNSAFFNVVDDSDTSGAALFVGQNTTSRSTIIPVTKDGRYLLQPYLVRSVARRGRQVDYVLRIELH